MKSINKKGVTMVKHKKRSVNPQESMGKRVAMTEIEAELRDAKIAAKEAGYGSGSLASVIRNLAELAASSRRALDDLVEMRNVCKNPNHALADGSPHPHELGPSCMVGHD